MSDSEASAFEEQVARGDPDRYVAALFAPPARRRALITLYAFNLDVARIRDIVHEPLVGHIRLGWWREQIAEIFERRTPTMPVAAALADTISAFDLPRHLFEAYLDARALDFNEVPFADEAAIEGYADATAGSLLALAARVCGVGSRADAAALPAGHAIAYTGFIRALGFDAAHRFCRIPVSWLETENLTAEDIFSGRTSPQIRNIVARLAQVAGRHARTAREQRIPTAALPALASLSLVDTYLKRSRQAADPFEPIELGQLERVARIAFAALTWRI